jgi:hypothetical protein
MEILILPFKEACLTRIIHEISFMQIQGVEIRRNTCVFQGFRNKVDA